MREFSTVILSVSIAGGIRNGLTGAAIWPTRSPSMASRYGKPGRFISSIVSPATDRTKEQVEYSIQSILSVPTQPGNQPLTDGELYWKITHGVGKMPAFAGKLTDTERWLVVNHLRSLPPVQK